MPTGVYPRNKKLHNLFQEGIAPWNKGKRYSSPPRPELKGKSFGTPFERGQVPWNKQNKLIMDCFSCGKSFEKLNSSKRKYCSQKCYWKNMKGWPPEKCSNWRGGISTTWPQRHRDLMRFYVNKRRAIQRGNGGTFTKREWEQLKKDCFFGCKMCGRTEPVIKLTIDHIVPVTRGGNSYITNIQPLCLSCNSRKGNYVS